VDLDGSGAGVDVIHSEVGGKLLPQLVLQKPSSAILSHILLSRMKERSI